MVPLLPTLVTAVQLDAWHRYWNHSKIRKLKAHPWDLRVCLGCAPGSTPNAHLKNFISNSQTTVITKHVFLWWLFTCGRTYHTPRLVCQLNFWQLPFIKHRVRTGIHHSKYPKTHTIFLQGIFLFMCTCVCLCTCMGITCVQYPRRSEQGVRSLRLELQEGINAQVEFWETDSGPLNFWAISPAIKALFHR